MKVKVYNQKGESVRDLEVSEDILGVRWNESLVAQAIQAIEANARRGTAHTKDRGEVRGGGKKPWKQKGTGRARHGSIRSPIWIGGGTTHGPRKDKDYSQKINKKMRRKALLVALSKKLSLGEVVFIEAFSLKNPRTSDAKGVLKALSGVKGFEKVTTGGKNAVLLATAGGNEAVAKSFRNIPGVELEEVRNLNARTVLAKKILIIENPEAAVEFFKSKLSSVPKEEPKIKKSPKKKVSAK